MINRLGYLLFGFTLLVGQVSAYISATYGGYLFTTPDSTDDNKRTKTDAATWCKNNGTKLLEIPSNNVQSTVVEYINGIYRNQSFNGWTTVVNAKRYNQNWDWVNGQGINNLAVEQQTADLSRSFGYLQSTGPRILVAAGVPTDIRGYICEGPSFCGAGGVMFQQRCYRSYAEPMSWFDARNMCLNGGGDLASFDFVNDSPGLSVLNGTWLNPAPSYWIGIRRALWKWEDSNSEVKYTQWVDGHPDFSTSYECICLYYISWKWIMCDCGQKYQFLCLIAASSSATTKTSTTSTSTTTTRTTTKTSTTTTSTNAMTRPTSATVKSFTTSNFSSSLGSSSVAPGPWSIPVHSGKSSALTYNAALGVGLGVGIGGGLIISAIIVAVYIWARRRGWPGTFPVLKKSQPLDSSHQQVGSAYALIPSINQIDAEDKNVNDGRSNIVYSGLDHLSSSIPTESSFVENNLALIPIDVLPGETIDEIINGDIKHETVA